jgi:hypothetical protein
MNYVNTSFKLRTINPIQLFPYFQKSGYCDQHNQIYPISKRRTRANSCTGQLIKCAYKKWVGSDTKLHSSRFLSLADELHIHQCKEIFESKKKELLRDYPNQYVAICEGRILTINPTFDGLINEALDILKKESFKHRPHLMQIK